MWDSGRARHTDTVGEQPCVADDNVRVRTRRGGGGVLEQVCVASRKNPPVPSLTEHTPSGHCRQCAAVQWAQTELSLEDAVE